MKILLAITGCEYQTHDLQAQSFILVHQPRPLGYWVSEVKVSQYYWADISSISPSSEKKMVLLIAD